MTVITTQEFAANQNKYFDSNKNKGCTQKATPYLMR